MYGQTLAAVCTLLGLTIPEEFSEQPLRIFGSKLKENKRKYQTYFLWPCLQWKWCSLGGTFWKPQETHSKISLLFYRQIYWTMTITSALWGHKWNATNIHPMAWGVHLENMNVSGILERSREKFTYHCPRIKDSFSRPKMAFKTNF